MCAIVVTLAPWAQVTAIIQRLHADAKTVQLDDYIYGPMRSLSNDKSKIRVLKIDVEGYEGDVLKTLTTALTRHDVENILFECIPYIQGLAQAQTAFALLRDHGYSIAECPFTYAEGVRNVKRPFIRNVSMALSERQVDSMLQRMYEIGLAGRAQVCLGPHKRQILH